MGEPLNPLKNPNHLIPEPVHSQNFLTKATLVIQAVALSILGLISKKYEKLAVRAWQNLKVKDRPEITKIDTTFLMMSVSGLPSELQREILSKISIPQLDALYAGAAEGSLLRNSIEIAMLDAFNDQNREEIVTIFKRVSLKKIKAHPLFSDEKIRVFLANMSVSDLNDILNTNPSMEEPEEEILKCRILGAHIKEYINAGCLDWSVQNTVWGNQLAKYIITGTLDEKNLNQEEKKFLARFFIGFFCGSHNLMQISNQKFIQLLQLAKKEADEMSFLAFCREFILNCVHNQIPRNIQKVFFQMTDPETVNNAINKPTPMSRAFFPYIYARCSEFNEPLAREIKKESFGH